MCTKTNTVFQNALYYKNNNCYILPEMGQKWPTKVDDFMFNYQNTCPNCYALLTLPSGEDNHKTSRPSSKSHVNNYNKPNRSSAKESTKQ